MDATDTFDVVANGLILDGFQHADVKTSFAELFKCSVDKASNVVGNEVTLKKQVNQKTAQAYKQRLEGIGLGIDLKENKPKVPSGLTLSLEPTEEELLAEQQPAPTAIAEVAPLSSNMVCPKCNLEQEKAEQCAGCGVYMHKVLKVEDPVAAPVQTTSRSNAQKSSKSPDAHIFEDGIDTKAIIAGAVAALVGAFVWKMIAIEFGRESGFVAWGIGGAVGFAAAMFGSRGQNAGIICAVLTVAAILGGKFLYYSEFQSQLMNALSDVNTEEIMRESYNVLAIEASDYAKVDSDRSLREFLVEHGYSEYENPARVSEEEIEYFITEVAPDLKDIHDNNRNFEDWVETSVTPVLSATGTFSMVLDSLDWIDLLFLFFGVATAFRLGSRQT